MNAKQWLNRGFKLDQEIDQLEKAKTKMRDSLVSATPSYEAHGGTSSPDPHKFDAYADYCVEIDNRIDELKAVEKEIRELIEKIDNTEIRALLIARYINFETFEQIAVCFGRSWRWVMYTHKEALHIVEKML